MSGVTNVSSSTSAAFLKPAVDVAVRPRVGRILRNACPWAAGLPWPSSKSASVHFSSLTSSGGGACGSFRPACGAGAGGSRYQVLPSDPRVRAAGPQRLERIDHERQRLEIDLDLFDGLGGGQLVHGGDRQNRLALIQRLIGQRLVRRSLLAAIRVPLSVRTVGRRGQIFLGQDRLSRPASPSAALASMCLTRACGTGLSSSLQNSMPSAR